MAYRITLWNTERPYRIMAEIPKFHVHEVLQIQKITVGRGSSWVGRVVH